MFEGFVNGSVPTTKILVMGALAFLLAGFIYFIVVRLAGSDMVKGLLSTGNLKGELVYDIGRKVLKRSIVLDGTNEMEMSIGPEVLTDNHMSISKGSSFKFTVSAVRSRDGDRIVNVKCHPPGVLIDKGNVNTEANLYNGDEILMNDISIKYVNGRKLTDGENKLKGRM